MNRYKLKQTNLRHLYLLMLAALILTTAGCGASSPYYKHAEERPDYRATELPAPDNQFTLFLIGDTGDPSTEPLEPNLAALRRQLEEAGKHSAVVFMGDNIYTHGLLPEGHPERGDSERRIDTQLHILKGYPGRAFFIPGNHDWNNSEPNGLESILRQQNYIESESGGRIFFLPDNGCPGPVEVTLDSSNTLLLLDTSWWLYPHEKPGPDACSAGSEGLFIQAVDSLVRQNLDRNLFIAAHHPIFSNGTHGGYSPFTDHVFPLLRVHDALYIPLPVIGSAVPLYRKFVGYPQDLPYKDYKRLREQLIRIFQQHPRLTYASGHDHSLQYHPVDGRHYIISGSGTVESYVRRGKTAAFAYKHKGFARIDINETGVVLSFWTPEDDNPQGKPVYRRVLYTNP